VPQGKLFGFLTFETPNDCQTAVGLLASANPTFNGNQLRIQAARPRANNRDMANMMAGGYGRGGFMMPPMDAATAMFFGRGGGYSPFAGAYSSMPQYPMPFAYGNMGGQPNGYGVMGGGQQPRNGGGGGRGRGGGGVGNGGGNPYAR
jgi:hypothetical protein